MGDLVEDPVDVLDGLAHREPAERVAVEVERGDLGEVAAPERGVDAALHDAEQRLPRRARRARQRSAHAVVRAQRQLLDRGVGVAGRALVEAIAMSEPSAPWISHRHLGREPVRAAVDVRAERDAVVVDASMAASEKTWKPPESVRIGAVQPANRWSPPRGLDDLEAGAQVQVIGVGEDDARRRAAARAARRGSSP